MPNGPEHEEEAIRRARESADAESVTRTEVEGAVRGFYYPVEGEEFITDLQAVEREALPALAKEAMAFKEGLKFGNDEYALDEPETVQYLQTLFSSVEGGIERPDSRYVDAAIKERVRKEVKRVKRGIREIKQAARGEKRGLSQQEKREVGQLQTEISQLTRIENQRHGRLAIDVAFTQRHKACEEGGSVANLLSRAPDYGLSVKPDKGHWQGALSGEFGEKVDTVLREIVRAGMETNIYASGFTDAEVFRKWLGNLLQKAEGRMDVVWFTWRLALLWELPAEFGAKEIDGKWKIADPPLGNDLHTWITWMMLKRMNEWGVDADGRRIRNTKYLTHTGFPLSIAGIKRLCGSYLHYARVDVPRENNPREKDSRSLFYLWWEKGMKIGGDFGRDPNIIPWNLTELQPRGLDTDELGTGSFGLWFLTRFRANKVREDIRSRLSLRDLADPDCFGGRLRNWDKVFGQAANSSPPEEHPRTLWLLAQLMAHHPNRAKGIPAVREDPEMDYRSWSRQETWTVDRKGGKSDTVSVWEILNHAEQCGWSRKIDVDYIVKELNIRGEKAGRET